MSKVKRLVPELRFPEFDQDWYSYKLGEISSITMGQSPSSESYNDNENGIPLVQGNADLYKRKSNPSRFTDFPTKIVEEEDIIVTVRAPVGYVAIAMEKLCIGRGVAAIKVKNGYQNFIYHYLVSKELSWAKIEQGSTFSSISSKDLYNLSIRIPDIIEQQKIATFLSLIDKKIELLEKKIELLEEQKRGLLQKIFSQEIRFKKDDGSEYRKWKSVTLGSIGEFKTSSVDKKVYANQKEVYLINYMDVYRHKKINKLNLNELMKVSASDQEIKSSSVAKGDVLFTPSSETSDDIGHSEVISEEFSNVLFSYHLVRFRPSIEFDNLFLSYVFNTSNVLRQFANLSQGATRFTLSKKSFEEVEVVFPLDFEEQKIIADFLSKHDLLIENSKQKLESTKVLKKGLLQKMYV